MLGAGQRHIQVLGAGGVGGDEGQVDVGAHDAGQLDLGLLGGFLQALIRHAVLFQVDAGFLLEGLGHVIDDAVVEVVAAQAGIAVGGQHFKHAVADLQQAHVEGAAAQVVHQDLVGLFLVQTVGQGRGGGLVDDAQHFQTGDAAGVLGGLALAVGEVSGHGDDGLGHGFAQVAFGVRLQLLQDHGADLLRVVVLAVDGHMVIGAHLALDGGDGAVGIGDGLTLGDLAHQALAVLGEGHHGRGGAAAFAVGDDNGFAAFHDGHAAVGSTQVDTDDLRHNRYPLSFFSCYLWKHTCV